ncbi:hypothetical protein EJ03DRAFT_138188 [Teratosphaeria nubilosa]|uniref:BTB domain-containing protein n=1 Tax=Teratosphaeria nubilosa TaxID=161662 RepID=A0A6G1L561_9PEZI|nr:hypothetical protein EJ03DRAFT_138188 [Teratosphaeria nubilosa]
MSHATPSSYRLLTSITLRVKFIRSRRPLTLGMAGTILRCDRQKARSLGGNIVEVKVGAAEKVFKIQETLLRATSTFFDAALSRGWQEGQSKIITLPEDDADTFTAYAHWLYTGYIATDDNSSHDFDAQAELFVLGEKLMNTKLRNDVIDIALETARSTEKLPTNCTIDIIYEGTPKGSPARKLMVDIFIACASSEWIDKDPSNANHEFLHELAIGLLDGRQKPKLAEDEPLRLGPASAYHVPEVRDK